jgi:hypothetical protein
MFVVTVFLVLFGLIGRRGRKMDGIKWIFFFIQGKKILFLCYFNQAIVVRMMKGD